MLKRAVAFRKLATLHAAAARRATADAETPEELSDAAWWKQAIEYHRRMSDKYDRAARHPWISVPPDPDPPELQRRRVRM
jgi:hypothetical protein